MAFNKKTWKNRVSEFFNRYRVENVQTGAISRVYMNLDDGAVTQEGDVIDADTMNDLEDRIEEADNTLTNQIDSIYEVMGQNGAKNLLDVTARIKAGGMDNRFSTIGQTVIINGEQSTGATARLYPVENDESFVLPAGNYVLSGESSDSKLTFTFRKNGTNVIEANPLTTPYEFSASGNDYFTFLIRLGAGTYNNATVKAMICPKSWYDVDPTYQPYAETNKELTDKAAGLWDNMMDNGAVNLLKNTLTSQTINGVTCTVSSDGTYLANGTATAQINISIATITGLGGTYRLTGCPSGGSGGGYQLQIQEGSTYIEPGDYGNGRDYTFDASKTYNIRLVVRNGIQLNNLTFKPMLSDASLNLSYDDYVPYAMTNRELTEELAIKDVTITPSGNIFDAGHVLNIVCRKRMGKIVIISGNMPIQNALANDTVIFSVSKPPIARVNIVLGYANAEYKACAMYIGTDGNVKAYGAIPANANYCFSFMYLTE